MYQSQTTEHIMTSAKFQVELTTITCWLVFKYHFCFNNNWPSHLKWNTVLHGTAIKQHEDILWVYLMHEYKALTRSGKYSTFKLNLRKVKPVISCLADIQLIWETLQADKSFLHHAVDRGTQAFSWKGTKSTGSGSRQVLVADKILRNPSWCFTYPLQYCTKMGWKDRLLWQPVT